MKKIQELKELKKIFDELNKIAKKLHHYYETYAACDLTSTQQKRCERLEKRAEELARSLKLKAYFQRDPRGYPLFLIEEGENYMEGIPFG